MSKFAVEVKPDRHEAGSLHVAITHNGYQWQGIGLTPGQARKVIAAMQDFLGARPEGTDRKAYWPENHEIATYLDSLADHPASDLYEDEKMWLRESAAVLRNLDVTYTASESQPQPRDGQEG